MGTLDVLEQFMAQLSAVRDVMGLRIPNGTAIWQLSLNLVDFIDDLRQIVVVVVYLISGICLACELIIIKSTNKLHAKNK